MSAKLAPAPWQAVDGAIKDAGGHTLALMGAGPNADLVAAAPELYNAAIEMMRALADGRTKEIDTASMSLAYAVGKALPA